MFDQLVGDRRYVPVGAAGSDDHVVGECALTVKVDGQDILGFGIVERVEDGGENSGGRLASGRMLLRRGALLCAATLGC
jgi:hypothetical protein